MNMRKKKTKTDTIKKFWDIIEDEVTTLSEEMRNNEENLSVSDGLISTYKYQTISETADYLEESKDCLESLKEEIQKIEENKITVFWSSVYWRSRPKRISQILNILKSLEMYFIGDSKGIYDEMITSLENCEFPKMYG